MSEEAKIDFTKEGEILKPIDAFYTFAARCKGNMTSQEQEILHEVGALCESSKKKTVRWLDVCCGRGTILDHAAQYLCEDYKRLTYHAFDKDDLYIRDLAKRWKSGQIKIKCEFLSHGDVDYLEQHANKRCTYDFITLENVLHEILPVQIPALLLNCLRLCSKEGFLFLVDMQNLPVPELNAIVWSRADIETIIEPLFDNKADLPKVREIPSRDKRGNVIPLFCVKIPKSRINVDQVNRKKNRKKTENEIKAKIMQILQKKKEDLGKEIDEFVERCRSDDPVGGVAQILIPSHERFRLITLYEQYRSVNRALATM